MKSNATHDARFKSFQGLVEDTYEALLSVPLVSGGDLIGVINVHHRESHEHSPEEIGMLVFIGEQLGVAIQRRARFAVFRVVEELFFARRETAVPAQTPYESRRRWQ